MADEEESGIEQTSRFKDSLNQIYRIDRLWQDAHKHSRDGELMKWNYDLDRVWCELAGDLEKVSSEKDKKIKNKNDFDFIAKQNKIITIIIRQIAGQKTSTAALYSALLDKELFLRRLQNRLGKGTAFMDADEDTFE